MLIYLHITSLSSPLRRICNPTEYKHLNSFIVLQQFSAGLQILRSVTSKKTQSESCGNLVKHFFLALLSPEVLQILRNEVGELNRNSNIQLVFGLAKANRSSNSGKA